MLKMRAKYYKKVGGFFNSFNAMLGAQANSQTKV